MLALGLSVLNRSKKDNKISSEKVEHISLRQTGLLCPLNQQLNTNPCKGKI